jgi:hypothetical protein
MINTAYRFLLRLSARNHAQHVNTENASLEGHRGTRVEISFAKSTRVSSYTYNEIMVLTVLIRFVTSLVGVDRRVDPC